MFSLSPVVIFWRPHQVLSLASPFSWYFFPSLWQIGSPSPFWSLSSSNSTNDSLLTLVSVLTSIYIPSLSPCPALPCPALPCPALPCPALPCPALPCPALPCPALPCPALPCPALPLPNQLANQFLSFFPGNPETDYIKQCTWDASVCRHCSSKRWGFNEIKWCNNSLQWKHFHPKRNLLERLASWHPFRRMEFQNLYLPLCMPTISN